MRSGKKIGLERYLREIIFTSGDIAPALVRDYLRSLACCNGLHDAQAQAFLSVYTLANHLPKEYVDFALTVLLQEPECSLMQSNEDIENVRRHLWRYGFLYDRGWGDEILEEFREPDADKRPFAFLLAHFPQEGLHLISTTLNTAVNRWRDRRSDPLWCQRGRGLTEPRTPIPITLQYFDTKYCFWGDDEIYCWRSGSNNAGDCSSRVIASALRSLEKWMGEEIEKGRDPKVLFSQIFTHNQCLAVLDICLNVVKQQIERTYDLRNPQTRATFVAGLPLMACPMLWRCDSRTRDIAFYYAFAEDNSVQKIFRAAVENFSRNLPFFYEEEKSDASLIADLKQRMADCRFRIDKRNYHFNEQNGQSMVQWIAPQILLQREASNIALAHERLNTHSLQSWGEKTIETGELPAEYSAEAALEVARKLYNPDDFRSAVGQDYEMKDLCPGAVAAVAAALCLARFDWLQSNGDLAWCREVLLAAAGPPPFRQSSSLMIGGTQYSAAHGLAALIKHGVNDFQVKEHLLWLAASDNYFAVAGLFRILRESWKSEEVLCWNLLSLRLELCLISWKHTHNDEKNRVRARIKRIREVIRRYTHNLKRKIIPQLPTIENSHEVFFHSDMMSHIVPHLPHAALLESDANRSKAVSLIENLLNWTIIVDAQLYEEPKQHYAFHDHEPYKWNNAFFHWIAIWSRHLSDSEMQERILNRVKQSWRHTPGPTSDLLQGYLMMWLDTPSSFSPTSANQWKQIAGWALDDFSAVWKNARHHEDDDVTSLIVFGYYFSEHSRLPDHWPHLSQFQDTIDRWVEVLGARSKNLGFLISMLKKPGRCFWPDPAVTWLYRSVQSNKDLSQLWSKNPRYAPRLGRLLYEIWSVHNKQIRNDSVISMKLSFLVDDLVRAGEPLASQLQAEMESSDLG